MTSELSPAEQQTLIDAFWADARRGANLEWLPGYGGATPVASLQPPAWSFGATPEQADRLLALVLDGTKTATASLLADYGADDPVPETGTMGIILDGSGRPRALVATTDVHVVPFGAVDAEHAHAEGEGDRSLAYWRSVHREFFRHVSGVEVSDDEPVVLERFRVLFPKPRRASA